MNSLASADLVDGLRRRKRRRRARVRTVEAHDSNAMAADSSAYAEGSFRLSWDHYQDNMMMVSVREGADFAHMSTCL
jgi:hypothetical protein